MNSPVKPSMVNVGAGTVALIASDIITRRVNFRELEATDFSSMKIYGYSDMSYIKRTMFDACTEAWLLIETAEETRPVQPPNTL